MSYLVEKFSRRILDLGVKRLFWGHIGWGNFGPNGVI